MNPPLANFLDLDHSAIYGPGENTGSSATVLPKRGCPAFQTRWGYLTAGTWSTISLTCKSRQVRRNEWLSMYPAPHGSGQWGWFIGGVMMVLMVL